MSQEECPRCNSVEGHFEWELIEVDGKYFCPFDWRRVFTEEESEEWTSEQFDEARDEKLTCVRQASYKIIKVPREKSKEVGISEK